MKLTDLYSVNSSEYSSLSEFWIYWIFFDLWITFLPLASCLVHTSAVFVLSSNALIYWSPMATFPFISFKWFVAAFFLSTFWIRTCVFLICCHLDSWVLLLSNNKYYEKTSIYGQCAVRLRFRLNSVSQLELQQDSQ